jgi:hypothetical protein
MKVAYALKYADENIANSFSFLIKITREQIRRCDPLVVSNEYILLRAHVVRCSLARNDRRGCYVHRTIPKLIID